MAFVLILFLFWLLAVLTSMEMATFSARRERMAQASQSGDRRGTMVNAFQRAPADYLSAIQLIATAANFIIGAMIGVNIELPLRQALDDWFPGFGQRHYVSWILAVGGMTVLALIFTNVLPKHIGFVRANEIALKAAPIMRGWIKMSWPITLTVRRATKLLAKLLHIAPDEKFRVTEKDIDALLLEGVRSGSLDPTEQAVMRRALHLSEIKIADVMVPREKMQWVDLDWDGKRVEAYFRRYRRSNFPVVKDGPDDVRGVVRVQEWLLDRNLERVMCPPVFASPSESLVEAVERLRPSESRLLIVLEGEKVVGVVTLNDVLAYVVGSIRKT